MQHVPFEVSQAAPFAHEQSSEPPQPSDTRPQTDPPGHDDLVQHLAVLSSQT